MKHLLNDLSEEVKNSIREQHTGGMKVVTENFSKLLNTKSGSVKLVVTEQQQKEEMSEQATPTGATPNTKYMAAGTKMCFFGSCRIDIKVVDKTTSQIITSKGAEGTDANSLYPQVVKLVQDELTAKKITGVTLPTLQQLQDTSPK